MARLIGIRELFEFDLNGYLVLPRFISAEQVQDANRILDAQSFARQSHKFSFILTPGRHRAAR